MVRRVTMIGLVALAFWPVPGPAQEKISGREIMELSLRGGDWKDMQGDLTMILTNARGQQRVRKLKFFSRKRTPDESDMLMRFLEPADVRDTGFLILEHKDADDDRYLYLPALRRVSRITASGRGGNFMGSDFSYYDIGRPKLNDWNYQLLGEELVGGNACYKIECTPASPDVTRDTRYSKIIRWIRKDVYTTVRAEYYDRDGQLWKVLEVPEHKFIGGIWFATRMIMKDVQIQNISEMRFENLEVNTGLAADLFSERYLRRGS
ncbi:MAG: outer membrane lipoprotein-sorting protein [candidate division KSB1 bacterium]|nr:outer membrane lipoprotein-sorting protein [candidate division KSB1 bacterium]